MNQSKRYFFSLLSVALLSVAFASNAAAQQQLEPSYEVALQVLIGSNDTGARGELPSSLSTIAKQLKNNFSFNNYRLANTFLGRVSNNGNIEYKSVSNVFGEESNAEGPQSFLEWSLVNFQVYQTGLQARQFRFGARIPVRTMGSAGEGGKTVPIVSYEHIGLSVNTIGVPVNKPTLIGTINLPRSSGTMFLVATIKPAEM